MPLRTARLVLVVAIVATTAAGSQDERRPGEALTDRANQRLQSLHAEADRLAAQERTVLTELRRFEVERQIHAEEYADAERRRETVSRQIESLDRQIAEIEHTEAQELPGLRARLVNLYKLGSGRYTRLLLSTSDLSHLSQASRMISVLAVQDRLRIDAHQKRRGDLAATRATLEEQQAQLTTLRSTLARARAEADAAVAARTAMVNDIDQRRDLNAQLTGELATAQQRLQATLTDLSANSAAGAAASLPLRPFRGDLDWPVAGSLRQAFGASLAARAAPSNGIDIAAAEGADVHAVHDGRVVYADTFTGFGRLVIVDHGAEAFSLYGNLREAAVASGAKVERGQRIGTVGVSATGAAGLYFELRIDGRPVDPLQWLKGK